MTVSSENNVIWRGVSELRSVLVLLDVVIILLKLTIVLPANGKF